MSEFERTRLACKDGHASDGWHPGRLCAAAGSGARRSCRGVGHPHLLRVAGLDHGHAVALEVYFNRLQEEIQLDLYN